jgi:hypothetical protein
MPWTVGSFLFFWSCYVLSLLLIRNGVVSVVSNGHWTVYQAKCLPMYFTDPDDDDDGYGSDTDDEDESTALRVF